MNRPPLLLSACALVMGVSLAEASETGAWLSTDGAGSMVWGGSSQPMDVVPRSRAVFLPDSGYVGRSAAERPDDLELKVGVPAGEQRFLRYVDGKLVDAWIVRQGVIDTNSFSGSGEEEWSGVVLGPAEDGYRAFGIGRSWDLGDRTVFHWRDRTTATEVVASRAKPSGSYAVERSMPLEPMGAGRLKAKLKGPLKDWVAPVADHLSGCLEQAPKPVNAELFLRYDDKGQPGLIRVETDQPAPAAVECFAAAVVKTSAPPKTHGSVTVSRFR